MERIHRYESDLTTYLINGLLELKSVKLYVPALEKDRIGVISFTVTGMHPHEVAGRLDENDILVRSGHHCCQPLMKCLKIPDGTVRISLAAYNTKEEIDLLIATLKEITGQIT
jgi:cysteine desulfurase/selenocysteine lyase